MSAGIIGRECELAAAQSFLDDVASGACALLVEGEPGIGKTVVWRAVIEQAMRHGYRILSYQAEQAENQLSLVGLGDLISEAADEELSALPPPQRGAIELALMREAPPEPAVPEPRTLAAGLTALLARLARARPVLVAIDDLQWLDASTTQMLAFAMRRLSGSQIGLLATLRAPTPEPDPLGLERALGADRLTRLRLAPLDLAAIRLLLLGHLGREYPRQTLLRIMDASGGNPLFALEIARALGSCPDRDPDAPLPVPDSLREFVAIRIGTLAPRTREALLATAALGRPRVGLVECAASAAGLADAEESGLVTIVDGRVVFTHPLYASAVYQAAATSRRREIHRRLAELVDDPEEGARHLALAAAGPDARVVALLEVAAIRARARGAWESAGELLERARMLTPSCDAPVGQARGIRAAEYYVHAGNRARGRSLLEDILAGAPPGPTRWDALRLLAEIHYNDENFREASALFEVALAHTEDQRVALSIELGLSYVSISLWDIPAAVTHARGALERATAIADNALLGEALGLCAMTGYLQGDGIDWKTVEHAISLEDPERIAPLPARPSAIAALLLLYTGHLSEARERLTGLCATARKRADESDLAVLLFWLAWLETMAGDLTAATRFVDEGALVARVTGSRTAEAWVLTIRGLLRAHRGEIHEARHDCAEAMILAKQAGLETPIPWIGAALALLETSLGNAGGAWRAVEALTGAVEVQGIGEPFVVPFLPDAIAALITLGQLDRAAALLALFERRAQELDRSWALATSARCRGLLLAARGDLEAADSALDQALVAHARLEMPFELARTLLVQGRIRRRRRRKRAAKESLEHALKLFERIGARLWIEQARAELDRLGLRRAPRELTVTEERVALLAASGRTIKEIAAELFVSPKTAQANLARAYEKLGVTSRAELGAHMARGGAAPVEKSDAG